MKWIKNFIRKICEFNIIMSKTTIFSLDIIESFDEMNMLFKNKIKPKK